MLDFIFISFWSCYFDVKTIYNGALPPFFWIGKYYSRRVAARSKQPRGNRKKYKKVMHIDGTSKGPQNPKKEASDGEADIYLQSPSISLPHHWTSQNTPTEGTHQLHKQSQRKNSNYHRHYSRIRRNSSAGDIKSKNKVVRPHPPNSTAPTSLLSSQDNQ